MSRPHGTGIEWTHFPDGYRGVAEWRGVTWNPIVGCSPARGSEKGGCLNCYARVLHNRRHANNREAARGVGKLGASIADIRALLTASHLGGSTVAGKPDHPLPWPSQYDQPFAKVRQMPHLLDAPLRWRKPHAVFVGSMTDLFHDDVPGDYLDRVFATMALAPQHVYMVLTKRPERMRAYMSDPSLDDRLCELNDEAGPRGWPLPNVWLGVTVEDQTTADERIPLLLDTPAVVRFISAEPLLGPVDLGVDMIRRGLIAGDCPTHDDDGMFCGRADTWNGVCGDRPALHWLIVGGESGPGHRPMDPAWARSVRDQCEEAGVAYFYKQHGGPKSTHGDTLDGVLHHDWPAA